MPEPDQRKFDTEEVTLSLLCAMSTNVAYATWDLNELAQRAKDLAEIYVRLENEKTHCT